MDKETSIGSLVDEIELQIDDKIQALKQDFELQREILVNGFKQEAAQETSVFLEQELSDLKSNVLQSESQAKWKVKKDLFVRRNELVDHLFEEAAKQLKAYSQTKTYDAWCKTKLEELLQGTQAQDGIVLTVKPVDRPLFDRLCKTQYDWVKVQEDENIFIGGFILSNTSRHTELDLTLDYKLCVQKEWFFSHSGLDF